MVVEMRNITRRAFSQVEKEKPKMILDVGCGLLPEGDVNVDLFTEPSRQRPQFNSSLPKMPNFVKADAQHLPFKDCVFDVVQASHCIEHVPNPVALLDELVRVSKFKVIVKCPHYLGEAYSMRGKGSVHLWHFKRTWFVKYANARGLTINSVISEKRGFPFWFFSITELPLEIKVTFIK
jgi:ubiquinone/menaquinone biosynthesis C-methylase UbiE